MLSTWFQAYPGDFTGRATFESLQSFLESLLPRGATWVAHYAIELIPLLKSVSRMDDPDTSWALPDESLIPPPPETVVEGERRRPSLVPSFESSGGAPTPRLGGTEAFNPAFDSSSFPPLRRRESDTKTSGTGDSTERRREGKDGKATQMGLLLEYSNTLLLEGSSEDMIATQITRLAWDAFSEITVSWQFSTLAFADLVRPSLATSCDTYFLPVTCEIPSRTSFVPSILSTSALFFPVFSA